MSADTIAPMYSSTFIFATKNLFKAFSGSRKCLAGRGC